MGLRLESVEILKIRTSQKILVSWDEALILSLFTKGAVTTIVFSSAAGAAEWHGDSLGEFVKAGNYNGRPFYKQRDTEGIRKTFLYNAL